MLATILMSLPLPQEPVHSGRANHLVHETSPYLLQHAYNPVNWYPWGDEAIELAKKEDRPIFLSIGYSACHWCHVMERESFEDEEIAEFLNANYICIKVDREERPDLDDLYMTAVQRMTGSGGWPMSVFLTPDLKPFFGGTYFPPREKFGRPGFLDILLNIRNAWRSRRDEIETSANQLGEMLALNLPPAPSRGLPDAEKFATREQAWLTAFTNNFDSKWGGFGPAPKFPHTDDIRFLLGIADRYQLKEASDIALYTLRKMADGGMYDQLAGGFARYSTDEKWLIPHFEKMLYDQGTLIPCYLEAWVQSGDEFFARVARESCDYLLREMQSPEGGFWSSTDADSEGEEGKYFVWTPDELEEVLGKEDGAWAAEVFGVTQQGNFEHGSSALTLRGDAHNQDRKRFAKVRAKLLETRAKRVPPATDDKVLTAWNGLAIDALAQAGRVFGETRYVDAASSAADFLLNAMRTDGKWLRAWRGGKAQHSAVLEDHAYLCRAMLSLFQATGEERWLDQASDLAARMIDSFWNPKTGVFFDTDGRDKTVLHRRSSPWDGAIPSPNAVALESLVVLHAFTHEDRWKEISDRGYSAALALMSKGPRGFAGTLRSLWMAVAEPRVAVIIGGGKDAELDAWRLAFHCPGGSTALQVFRTRANPDSEYELFQGRNARDETATLYLCQGTSCLPPNVAPQSLTKILE